MYIPPFSQNNTYLNIKKNHVPQTDQEFFNALPENARILKAVLMPEPKDSNELKEIRDKIAKLPLLAKGIVAGIIVV